MDDQTMMPNESDNRREIREHFAFELECAEASIRCGLDLLDAIYAKKDWPFDGATAAVIVDIAVKAVKRGASGFCCIGDWTIRRRGCVAAKPSRSVAR